MSYGNCCLVSDIPECLYVVADKAISFEHGNINDLSAKIQLLCDSPDVVANYKAGVSSYICGKFNWDDIVKSTLKLYENNIIQHSEVAA